MKVQSLLTAKAGRIFRKRGGGRSVVHSLLVMMNNGRKDRHCYVNYKQFSKKICMIRKKALHLHRNSGLRSDFSLFGIAK